jgi:hypothetical protein
MRQAAVQMHRRFAGLLERFGLFLKNLVSLACRTTLS